MAMNMPAYLLAWLIAAASGTQPQSNRSDVAPFLRIALQKQYVPVLKETTIIAYKTSYFGKVYVGTPSSEFTVVFDTGSGHFILPSTSCSSETCAKHKGYNRSASQSAIDIDYDGSEISPDAAERDQVAIAFGTGEVVGELIREKICLGGQISDCVTLRCVLATEMTADPFGLFAFDGVLGLGLDALALNEGFSFMSQMVRQHPAITPRFSVFLARTDAEESMILFGSHDPQLAADLAWAPVAMPELGYWQVQLRSVRIGDTELEECADGGCRAILDTGTSLLGVPRQVSKTMLRLLARAVPEDRYGNVADIDCRQVPGPMIHFDLGGSTVSLGPEDHSRPVPFNMTVAQSDKAKLFCRSLLLPLDMEAPLGPKVFIWGEPVLKRYYTVYDWAKKEIGFGVARADRLGGAPIAATIGAPPKGSLLSGSPLIA